MMEADESFIVFRGIIEVLKKGQSRAFTSLGEKKIKIKYRTFKKADLQGNGQGDVSFC